MNAGSKSARFIGGRAARYKAARLFLFAFILFSCPWPAHGGEAPQDGACPADIRADSSIPDLSESLEESLLALSDRGCKAISGRHFERELVTGEVTRLAGRVRERLGGDRDPRRSLAAIGRVLFEEERYAYEASGTDADLYMLDRVVARKRGNCLGLTLLYALIGERIGLPLTGSYVPGHIFVRYDSGGERINIEMSRQGAELSDAEYRRVFALGEERPYLRTLDRNGLAAVFVKTVGASCACDRRDEEALKLYDEAKRMYPELADIYFNTGISLQRAGRPAQAAEEYRKCLSLDPGMSSAREKLDSASGKECGSCDFRKPTPGTGGNGESDGR